MEYLYEQTGKVLENDLEEFVDDGDESIEDEGFVEVEVTDETVSLPTGGQTIADDSDSNSDTIQYDDNPEELRPLASETDVSLFPFLMSCQVHSCALP